jgi:hypothetical protein
VHVNDVVDVGAVTAHIAPPTVTVEPPVPVTNPVPDTVIDVVAVAGPFAGETDATVGAAL